MNLLAIAADIDPDDVGGAERHFIEVLKHVSPHFEKIDVLVGESDSLKGEFRSETNVTFIKVRYPRITNLIGLFYILFSFPQVISLLKKNKYDLIWAKQEFPQAQICAFIRILSHKPLYITAQNPALHREELVVKGSLLRPFSKIWLRMLDKVVSWGLRQADLVAAVSDYSAKQAKKMGVKNITIIPNGVSLQLLRKLRKNTIPRSLKIFTSSTLIPRNGIDVLIKACSLLPSRTSWTLTIAGDGPLRSELEKMIISLGIQHKVKILGIVTNRRVFSELDKCFLFCRPSRFEGFGISFAEAMARGIPAIGTPVGGITDFLTHNKTGLLVPVDDPQNLSKAMLRLWKDRRLYDRLRNNGWQLIKNRYNWNVISTEVLTAFSQLTSYDRKKTA